MKKIIRKLVLLTFVFSLFNLSLVEILAGQRRAARQRSPARASRRASTAGRSQVQEKDVRAHMEFLASDALQGRGSGTQYELIAGRYVAAQLRQFGIAPAGDAEPANQKSFLQAVQTTNRTFAKPPTLSLGADGNSTRFTHGQEMLVGRIAAAHISGRLQKIDASGKAQRGDVVFIQSGEAQQLSSSVSEVINQGAAAVLIEETPRWRRNWSPEPPSFREIAGVSTRPFNLIILSTAAAQAMRQAPEGTPIEVSGQLAEPDNQLTWNVIGELRGSDAKLSREAVVISAHMDHLGVRAGDGDQIYNGADDDASGVTAVLELARALGTGPRPRRTVYFVLFGSEEVGGFGAQYFLERPPAPLETIIANLEFEMIGRPDSKVAADTLWLTGYERSNLGPQLAARGARLVADPHPEQNFFQRSDNYALARRGVVAHTVSSFGLHPEYHQPNDDLAHINFPHMTRAINSMLAPVRWLVNSSFRPTWVEGQRP